jgi:hypothetical protein
MKQKKNKILIEDPEIISLDTRYASQTLSEIPLGCWIDKSVGGCGLSYLCLTDVNDSVILMPRNKLIENKVVQSDKYKNLFVVNGGVKRANVAAYVDKMKKLNLPIKILITYDSFALGKVDYLLFDVYIRVYIDESQFLLDFALNNPKLINELHNRLEGIVDRVSFFSAHPPKREYLPEYIQNMRGIKYLWKNQIKATPYVINSNKPYMVATKLLSELLTKGQCTVADITFKKAIVFLNSVDGLRKIIEPLNSKDNIAYIVGDTVRNDSKLNDYAHSLEDCSNLPTITIGTTSLISGFDLYDEETLNIVISTSSKEFTLMDKELDVPQAITRQRLDSNPFNNKFIFILDVKNMEDKIAKLEETYNEDYKKLTIVVENLNYLKDGGKNYSVGYELYEGYYLMYNDKFYINENLLKARKYIFEQLYHQYKNGYNVISTNKPSTIINVNSKIFHNKQYVDYVKEIKECDTIGQKMTMLESVPNEKWKSYITYGLEKDNLLMNVKEARLFYESRNDYKGIIIAIYKKFKLGEFYSLVDIKSELNEIYKSKKFNRTAKATDLYEFFEIKSCNKRINGKLTSGVLLNSKK